LSGLTNTAIIDFIDVMLDKEYISVEGDCEHWKDVVIIARNNYMPLQSEVSELLDKCVLLNTYLSGYFKPCGYIKSFDIYFEVDVFDNNFSMYQNINNIKCPNTKYQNCSYKLQLKAGYKPYHNSLFVNGLVLENTEAGQKVERQDNSEYTEYNFVFTKLSENLKKEASGK
jgi:hypothetical protein